MCGFVAILNRDPRQPVDRELLAAATERIRHRGPDDVAIWSEGSVGLGFRRLAVVGLGPGGRQPMHRPEDAHTLVFNGEIYGYRDEREALRAAGRRFRGDSDSEVLLQALAHYGVERALTRLQGMYAFACWDARGERLILARDRLGQKPLYLWEGPERIVAASELKALFADPSLPRRLDPRALEAYLAFGSIPEPRSILRGVRKLPPGSFLELDRRGATIRRGPTWRPAEGVARARPAPAQAARELRARLQRALRSHLVADVPLGAYLSGGLDSAGVVALAGALRREAGAPPLETFSVAFRDDPLDESEAAAATARALGTRHHTIDVRPDLVGDLPRIAWHLDEPFAIPSAAASYYLARETRRHVTVALSGDGADELFGGYPWRHGRLAPQQLVAALPRPRALRRLLRAALPPEAGVDLGGPDSGGSRGPGGTALKWLGALARDPAVLHADLLRVFRAAEARALLAAPGRTQHPRETMAELLANYRAPPRGDGVDRALYAETRTTLSHEMLAKVDRTSMAWGLEVRAPYLDRAVVELALSLPSQHKVGWRTGKRVLRAALAPLLPPEVLARPKRGFSVPVDAWFRGPLQEFARGQLHALDGRDLLRPGAAAAVLTRHLREPARRGQQVYALVALETWCRVFLDDRGERPAAGE